MASKWLLWLFVFMFSFSLGYHGQRYTISDWSAYISCDMAFVCFLFTNTCAWIMCSWVASLHYFSIKMYIFFLSSVSEPVCNRRLLPHHTIFFNNVSHLISTTNCSPVCADVQPLLYQHLTCRECVHFEFSITTTVHFLDKPLLQSQRWWVQQMLYIFFFFFFQHYHFHSEYRRSICDGRNERTMRIRYFDG